MTASPLNRRQPSLFIRCRNEAFQFFWENGEPLPVVDSLPKNWNKVELSGSRVYSYEEPGSRVVIQDYSHQAWAIRYAYFQFHRKTVIRWQEEPFLRIQFALQGNQVYQTPSEKIHLVAGSTNNVWRPGEETRATFDKNTEYVLFHVLYHPDLVRQLLPAFPHTSLRPEKHVVPIEKLWLSRIYDTLSCPYDESTCRFFYENQVRDILLHQLVKPGFGIRHEGLSREEVLKVHEVDALILADLRNWLHIPVLARRVHMSEFKLKTAYKQVIGVNLFERLRNARLERAAQLLTQTDQQIKAIFREVGYKSLSGFEEAFQEKYGTGPSKYRKAHQTRS